MKFIKILKTFITRPKVVTFIDIPKFIAVIILLIGWITGNLTAWIIIPMLLISSEWKFRFNCDSKETKEDDILNSQDFYEVMQSYRTSDMMNQDNVIKAFKNVKEWIRENYKS